MKSLHAEKAFIFPLKNIALYFDPDLVCLIFHLPLTVMCSIPALMERNIQNCLTRVCFPSSLASVQVSDLYVWKVLLQLCFSGGSSPPDKAIHLLPYLQRYLQKFLHHIWVLKQLDFHKIYLIWSPNLFFFCSHLWIHRSSSKGGVHVFSYNFLCFLGLSGYILRNASNCLLFAFL